MCDAEADDVLLHPSEVRPAVYGCLSKLIGSSFATLSLEERDRAALCSMAQAGRAWQLKARVFDRLDFDVCTSDQQEGLVRSRVFSDIARVLYDATDEMTEGAACKPQGDKEKQRLYSEAYEHCGRRDTMEDQVIHVEDIARYALAADDSAPTSMFGVFDGHGGGEASEYASENMIFEIARSPLFASDLEKCLTDAFERCDALFCEKCLREDISSGTTACVALIRGSRLHVAWVGDSKAMLVRNQKAVVLNEPHAPNREDERKRVEDAGGIVVWYGTWRVNGRIAVSRAIGDVSYKDCIIGTPSYDSLVLDGSETMIVLACDGLWDVMTEDECVQFCTKYVTTHGSTVGLSKALCNHAYDLNSTDNISAVVVDLTSLAQ